MTATGAPPIDRVIWVGTGRRARRFATETERAWRERLAQEMNEARDEMASRGLRLTDIVPVHSSSVLQLHFTRAG